MKRKLLYRFFEGKTTLEEEKKIRQWMESSPENATVFMKERKIFDIMVLTDSPQVKPEAFLPRKRNWVFFFGKAAALILITLLVDRGISHFREAALTETYQTISVPAGQRTNLTLPDGTNVWLNARTTLTYSSLFAKGDRKVCLDGEAYFEVSHDEEKPFVVESCKGTVEVLGTEFNVEAYSGLPQYEVALMRGKVKVTSVETPQAVVLSPDTKTVLVDGKLQVVRVDDFNPYRWRDGLICFRTKPFDDIMRSFEKYYGVMIRIDNPNVFKYTYTGKFRQSDGVEYALRVLQRDLRFHYVRDDDHNIIYIQ